MKASELRIGNKFECMGMIQTVFEICDNTDRGRIKQAGYEYIIRCEENGNQYKPIEIKPIPITAELLLRLGFKNDDGDFVLEYNRQAFMISKAQDEDLLLLYREDIGFSFNVLKFIEHIHDLQNLYYALTGEELTLSDI